MIGASQKKWEELSLDEKLTELGFRNEGGKLQADFRLTTEQSDRLHAALDQLFDAGMLLGDIEEMVTPAGTGSPSGDELNICSTIYQLITEGEEDDDDEDDT